MNMKSLVIYDCQHIKQTWELNWNIIKIYVVAFPPHRCNGYTVIICFNGSRYWNTYFPNAFAAILFTIPKFWGYFKVRYKYIISKDNEY
jgi:hypothetical protein